MRDTMTRSPRTMLRSSLTTSLSKLISSGSVWPETVARMSWANLLRWRYSTPPS
jgi:hypothetical protein